MGGDTPSEINKNDSDEQKRSSVYQKKINRSDWETATAMTNKRPPGKNRGDTPMCRPV